MKERRRYRIGEFARLAGVSPDTLRYYEKIGLLTRIARSASGMRRYDDRDLSRLRFIRRAQKMDFSLEEIGMLLKMREDPQYVRDEVRRMTAGKLKEVEQRLAELIRLRNELRLLLDLCRGSGEGCPIIEGLEERDSPREETGDFP